MFMQLPIHFLHVLCSLNCLEVCVQWGNSGWLVNIETQKESMFSKMPGIHDSLRVLSCTVISIIFAPSQSMALVNQLSFHFVSLIVIHKLE